MTPSYLHEPDSRSTAIGLLVLSSVLWGSSFVSVKIGLAYVNAYTFAFLRLAFGASILVPLLVLRGKFQFAVMRGRAVWILGLLNALAFLLQYVGLLYTTAAKTALLVDLNVLIVAVLSWWMFQESFGKGKQLGVFLGVVGALMITTNGDLSSLTSGQLFGDALVFSAGLIWALFIVMLKRILIQKEQNTTELSAMVMVATALFLLPASVLLGGLTSSVIPLQGWELIAYTAVAATVLPYVMWIAALKAVTATVAGVVGLLEIVAAMIMSSLLLGESYSTITLIGALLILFSLFAVAES